MANPFIGSQSAHYFVAEVTKGVVPTNPVFTKLRYTGGFPAVVKDTLISNELDNSGEVTSIRTGNESVSGDLAIELSQTSQDDLLASAMASTWVSGLSISTVEVTVLASAKTFTRTAGDNIADGVLVGDLIQYEGLTGDNAKAFIATSVSTLVVTGAAITVTLTDEVVTTDYSTGDKLSTGNDCQTYSILTHLVGRCGTVESYIITTGVEFTSFNIETAVNASVTGSFPFIGMRQEVTTLPAGSTFNPDLTTKQFTGTDGKVVKDGAILAFVTSMTIANDNGASGQFELGSKYTAFVERSVATNTISASAFMENTNILTEFINETEVNIATILHGQSGAMSFTLPQVVLTAVNPEIGGPTSVTQSIEGQGLGSSAQSSLIVQRLLAP